MKENYQQRAGETEDRLGILCPPPRFFSTHYSNSANVLWYLIRLEPYTSLHIFLQDGKFDRPDRQFWSLRNTYNGCTTNDGDVKELIPEFFYLPDFLRNNNKQGRVPRLTRRLNLGVRQDCADPIGDVELPPWAKTPEAFVRINRDALESEFVSAHIHKWIDLVFGFKQRGPEAEACYNVFSHVTYYGALDMEALCRSSRADWQQANDMLENFGQTPLQLFANPHHQRRPLQLLPPVPLLSYRDWLSPAGCRFLGAGSSRSLPAARALALYKTNINLGAGVIAVGVNGATGSVVTLAKTRALAVNPVKQQNGRSTPFDIGVDPLLRGRGCGTLLAAAGRRAAVAAGGAAGGGGSQRAVRVRGGPVGPRAAHREHADGRDAGDDRHGAGRPVVRGDLARRHDGGDGLPGQLRGAAHAGAPRERAARGGEAHAVRARRRGDVRGDQQGDEPGVLGKPRRHEWA